MIVRAVHPGIGVVAADQIADPFDQGPVIAELCQHLLRFGRTLLFLELAAAFAVFLLGISNADVVNNGGRLKDEPGIPVQPLLLTIIRAK